MRANTDRDKGVSLVTDRPAPPEGTVRIKALASEASYVEIQSETSTSVRVVLDFGGFRRSLSVSADDLRRAVEEVCYG